MVPFLMGLLSIIRKQKQKEKEMRFLVLYNVHSRDDP